MPIIPSNWTGQNSINIGNSSGLSSASEIFNYSISKAITVNDIDNYIDLIGCSTIDINREISLDILSGRVKLYWKNQDDSYTLINFSDLTFNNGFIDSNIDKLGFAIKCSEVSEIFFTCRWDKESNFYLYTGDELMIPVNVKLAIGTGNNFTDVNANSYDTNEYQYLINLNKLKNSDSGVTGWKLFDINCFYPGKPINFNVNISNNTSYDLTSPIALQLFDPLTIGEVLFAVANDVINLEINNLGDKFIGNLTRNAYYKEVINNSIEIIPDFSKHFGRFVAKNSFTGMYDTAIIESYTPNTDIYKGGTFILTGKF